MTQPEPEEAQNSNMEPETTGAGDEENLKQALAEERERAEDYLANWQRTQADFLNYKRRTEQERQDFSRYANAELIRSLLPVLDDLDRALNHTPPTKTTKHTWLEGVRLVNRKLRSILEEQGLKPINALGEPFNPNFHEALRQDRGKEGVVIEEFQKGYMMHDSLLRPARVVVGDGSEGDEEEEPTDI